MTEVQDSRLVRHPLTPKINADELAHGDRVIQRLLGGRVRQVEPCVDGPSRSRRIAKIGEGSIAVMCPALMCGGMTAHSSRHGTTCSISARNAARRVCLPCLSKPAVAKVSCRISVPPRGNSPMYDTVAVSRETCSDRP